MRNSLIAAHAMALMAIMEAQALNPRPAARSGAVTNGQHYGPWTQAEQREKNERDALRAEIRRWNEAVDERKAAKRARQAAKRRA